jgi:hypothetical protein
MLGERSRSTLILLYLPRFPLFAASLAGALLAPLTRRSVRLLVTVQVALCLVVLFPLMGLVVTSPRPTERSIRLASYNVYFGRAGEPALVEEIAATPADILVIQAAFGSLGEELQARLPGRTIRQDGEFVLMSRFPARVVVVPHHFATTDIPAMFVKYVIDTPGGTLRVYSVHACSPRHALTGELEAGGNIAQRDGQIAAVVAAARSVATGGVGAHFQRHHRYPGTHPLARGRRSASPSRRRTRVGPSARGAPECGVPLR